MFACTALPVVLVDNDSPRLVPGLEALGYGGDCVRFGLRRLVLMVKGDIDLSAFVIYRLEMG